MTQPSRTTSVLLGASVAASILLFGCGQPAQESSSKVDNTVQSAQPDTAVHAPSADTIDANAQNMLSPQEAADGFVLLFDGLNLEGWRGFNQDSVPSIWVVEDGTLHMIGESNMSEEQKANRADIIYDQQFSDFILKLEWKISENGNSGIFYLGQESSDSAQYDYIWKTAPEMQILDNNGHPDANKGKNGNRQAGSLYDLVPANPQNAAPVGQWNQVEIHVQDRKVKHIQNGAVVVEYEMDTPQWEAMIKDSKFPGLNANWAKVPNSGFIGLQDHSDPVWFRNIKVKPL
ncbi:DUF1080 domain-containing protein [Glaciecola siphonariae]|uniref:DUF1080 domain-containing protein n=1 Tax=Glaciecola siphonariae TaxID=521012 RepID=A0ABV9LSZ0_9ALTE